MSKEVATKQSTGVVVSELNEWGDGPEIFARDMVMPRILLMQASSKKVVDGDATFGQARDSLTNELLGDLKTPIEFVPFYQRSLWIEKRKVQGEKGKPKLEYVGSYPITPQNDGQEFEEGDLVRTRSLEFFVLTKKDLDAGTPVPRILAFRVTSLRAGRKLQTQMYTVNRLAKKGPASTTMKLIIDKKQNDEGTFVVMDVEPVGPTPPEYQAIALELFKQVSTQEKAGKLKVDESEHQQGDSLNVSEDEVQDASKGPAQF